MICQNLTRAQANALYKDALKSENTDVLRELCQKDLFFLLTVACRRKDIDKDWLYDRCREVEKDPDGHLDLWAREHYKSTIITFGLTIQDILNDPNITVGIFSHTRPIAKAFLDQIKRELEGNQFLQDLFPDVLYKNPRSEAEKWSLDSGIIVKRSQNPKEATIEAWGVVDGQPTSKHFALLLYDDVVTAESVTTPEQIKKTTDSLSLSYNLGADGGKVRFIGTRYHANDTYRTIMDRGTAKPRIHAAREGGKIDGKAVFLSDEKLKKKRRDFGPYIFACQMLQDPVADNAMGFKEDWLRFYKMEPDTTGWNIYLLVDPASEKKKTSDYTVVAVVGLAPDGNYYLLDAIRDRLNLTERAEALFKMHRRWRPIEVGYEKYGMQSDIEHIQYEMEVRNYRFSITELGGSMPKPDRIRRLVPPFEQHRFWLPEELWFTDYEGKRVDFVASFKDDEYTSFPVSVHDDMLDCISRIMDPVLGAEFPDFIEKKEEGKVIHYGDYNRGTGWMG